MAKYSIVVKNKIPELLVAIRKVEKLKLKVGVFDADRVLPETGREVSNVMLAYVHENGSAAANLPARPFMRLGMVKVRKELAESLVKPLRGKQRTLTNVKVQLRNAGAIAVKGMQDVISDGIALTPLKIDTVVRKASGIETPLYDTGQLFNAITFRINEHE